MEKARHIPPHFTKVLWFKIDLVEFYAEICLCLKLYSCLASQIVVIGMNNRFLNCFVNKKPSIGMCVLVG